MVSRLELFMQSLAMEPSPSPMELCPQEVPAEENQEVKSVLSHRVREGVWFFELAFANGETRWVADTDCQCEWLISNYLAEKDINTAYIFCRVSTKEQASSTSISLDAQEAEIRPLVTKYPRVKVYKISCSAYKKMPAALSEIGECATTGDGIFVWRIDRLSRNIVEYLAWMEDLNEHGVELYSVEDGLYYSSNKTEFIQAVLDAQKEADLIGSRVKLINKRKKQRGDEAVGSLPFGKKYERILDEQGHTVRKIVVPNEEEVALQEFIKNSPLAPDRLAEYLNSQECWKRGRKWSKGMINNMRK
jgi:DNA invertase Pin-like site-specific DNA recombinase